MKKLLILIYFFVLYLTFIFTRSILGVYILDYRVGEYFVGFSLIGTILVVTIFQNYFIKKTNKKIFRSYQIVIFYFIFSVIINKNSFLNIEIYKHSSIIWSIFYVFLGIYFADYFQITKKVSYFLNLNLFLVFYLQMFYFYDLSLLYADTAIYPMEDRLLYITGNNILDFFIINSDKFETYKGTGFLLFFILITFISNNLNGNSKMSSLYFYFISGLFIPVFLIRSRTAAFVVLIYIIFQITTNKMYFKEKKINFLLFLAFFTSFYFSINQINEESVTLQNSNDQLVNLLTERNQPQSNRPFLEIQNKRIYSNDGNLNWRLQIWQDVIFDLITSDSILFGYGFSGDIPAMKDSISGYYGRWGLDGLNKNVHNFIVNMLARGGVILNFLYFYFIYSLFKFEKADIGVSKLKLFLIPLFIASLFDASMENVHFPMFLYLYLGYYLNNKSVKYK